MAIYAALHDIPAICAHSARINKGLKYLADLDSAFFQGKHAGFTQRVAISGDAVYAVHQVYVTKPVSQARFETHRDYIDIQVVWKGREFIAVTPAEGLKIIRPYDPVKDIAFYRFHQSTLLLMKPGTAAVLYPCDAHAPCILFKNKAIVAKTVVKIRR